MCCLPAMSSERLPLSLRHLPQVRTNSARLDLCLHDNIWLTINTPCLSESHIVIRQHTDSAIGIIDKVLNPQWATAMCGWDGCGKGCRCWNGRTRVQSPHYDEDKGAWCNSQWMTHWCWSQGVGASLLVYWLKEAGKVPQQGIKLHDKSEHGLSAVSLISIQSIILLTAVLALTLLFTCQLQRFLVYERTGVNTEL